MDFRALVSHDRLKAHLEHLCTLNRLSGTAGDHRATDYVVGELHRAGVPVKVHEFDAYISHPGPASLQVIAPSTLVVPCITHSLAQPTPAGGLERELVFAGEGEEADYEGMCCSGKAVMFGGYRGLVLPEKVKRAEEHGAAAVVCINFSEVLHEMIVSTVWGTPTLETGGELPKIPVVSTGWSDGEALKHLLEAGRVIVSLKTQVDTGWRRLRLPVAEIRSNGFDDFFLLGGHMDSWYEGATDNATGDAVLLELALAFHRSRHELKRGVRVAWWPGHSHGRYAGSAWYADNAWAELDAHCVGVLIVDSPGVRGATVQRMRTAEESKRFALEILRRLGHENPSLLRPERVGDQSFLGMGVTSMSLNSELPPGHPDKRPVGGSGGGWWWHSKWDTIDKADVDVMHDDAVAIGEVVGGAVLGDVLPYQVAGAARHFLETLKERRSQCASAVDLGPAVALCEALVERAGRFDAAVASCTIAAPRANDLIKRVTRLLNAVLYTCHDRFHQDPAVLEELLPGLAAAKLVSSSDPDIAGFARYQVVKESNRIMDALRQAARLLEGV
ncbi:MAG: M28 family peptidase [Bacillota bacterium]|nr:M28 family peptidase [Bacillota bacterium]